MADTNPFANLGLQQVGREGRFVGQTFGEPMQDIKKLAAAYAFQKSGLKDWANKTFGTPPPTGLQKPDLLPEQMTGAPGLNIQSPSGMGLNANSSQGFKLGIAPPSAVAPQGMAPSASPSVPNPQYDPMSNTPNTMGMESGSMFDDAMERFGLKKFGNFGG